MSKGCVRVETALDKCIAKAPQRGCAESMAKVAECRGSKICPDSCGKQFTEWRCCNGSMMSVAAYRDGNGRLHKDCNSFLSEFAKCDSGWRWPITKKDGRTSSND